LEKELLIQPEEDEQTRKSQQEGKMLQMEQELYIGALIVMD
jgi:hypothetical protein